MLSGSEGGQRDAEAVAVLLRMEVKALINERGGTFADWSVPSRAAKCLMMMAIGSDQ